MVKIIFETAFSKQRDITVWIFGKLDVDQSSSMGDVTSSRCIVICG